MSKFHSTVSRRTFMKGLGLAGAGLGAAAAAAPAFHDLDEVAASPQAGIKRPWWVKEIDQPTVEIDWNLMQRYDKRNFVTLSAEDNARLTLGQTQMYNQKVLAGEPGFTMKDRALVATSWFYRGGVLAYSSFLGPDKNAFRSREFPPGFDWPQWQGTKEENSAMIRAAAKHFGAIDVGFVELTQQTRKLIFANNGKQDIVFADVAEPEETTTKLVIPDSYRWAITYSIVQSDELTRRTRQELGGASWGQAYSRSAITEGHIFDFLRGIGYRGLGGNPGLIVGFGVLGGLGEASRMCYLVNEEHGALVRESRLLITNLPLAPTQPIDAGLFRFCETCKKCAINCPSGAISMETKPPSPQESITGAWNNPGIHGWKNNYKKCYTYWLEGPVFGCGQCQGICVFNKKDRAFIHDVVGATLAITPIFNGFFTTMDDTFGYGLKDEATESWWDLNQPTFGIDTRRGTQYLK